MSAELRPGYKKTEVGVIPGDWDVVPMGQVGECLIGLTYSPLDVRDFGTLVLRSSNIQNGRLAFDDNVFVDMEVPARAITRKNDILICVRNGSRQLIGKCAIIDDKTAGSAFGAFMSVLRSDSAKFLFFQFQSNIQKRQIDEVMGATINQITNKNMAAFKVIWPPIKAEQEAIVEVLSDTDALIESLEQLIAKKRHIKQGAMQELLTGKKRLPGFSGEWEVTSLLELAAGKKELFDDGNWIESEHITSDGVRLIQTGNIGIGQFVEKEIKKYIFESSFISLRCKELREGDLLICRLAEPAGRACVLPNIGEPKIVTSVDVTIFRSPSSIANRVFLANLFSTDQWFREVSDKSGGTTHKRISRGALGRLKIKVPTLPEQTAIATILSDMAAEIAALETRLTKIRSIKQGIMYELLTGKIRLI